MLRGYKLSGRVVDLGAKSQEALHYDFIEVDGAEITYCDIAPRTPEIAKVDLEEPLPFESNQFDYVLLIHVLEHIYKTDQLLAEMRRICRGEALIVVPFAGQYHADPHDYYRFTHEALERKLRDAGFIEVEIKTVGRGPLLTAYNEIERAFSRPLRIGFLLLAWGLDKCFTALSKRYRQKCGVLIYIVKAR